MGSYLDHIRREEERGSLIAAMAEVVQLHSAEIQALTALLAVQGELQRELRQRLTNAEKAILELMR